MLKSDWTKDCAPTTGYYYIYDTDFENEISIAKLAPKQELAHQEYRSVIPVVLPTPPKNKDKVLNGDNARKTNII